MRGISRYIEDLLRGRRPRDFRASPDEAALARTAITLRSARPGSGAPTEEFVTGLHKRLAAELEDTRQEPRVSGRPRRAFMRAASAAAALATGAVLGRLATARNAPPASQAGGAIVPDEGSWQAVLASADLPDGAVHPFTLTTLTGFVERTGGRLRAVSGTCTHQGCRLSLAAPPTQLDCPCHGSVFALDGTVIRHRLSVQLTPLPTISVRESGGVIQVRAPRPPAPGSRLIAALMNGVSYKKAGIALSMYCIQLMQNLPLDEQVRLRKNVEAVGLTGVEEEMMTLTLRHPHAMESFHGRVKILCVPIRRQTICTSPSAASAVAVTFADPDGAKTVSAMDSLFLRGPDQ